MIQFCLSTIPALLLSDTYTLTRFFAAVMLLNSCFCCYSQSYQHSPRSGPGTHRLSMNLGDLVRESWTFCKNDVVISSNIRFNERLKDGFIADGVTVRHYLLMSRRGTQTRMTFFI